MKPLACLLILLTAWAWRPSLAAPGAHGPNGEHLDLPASSSPDQHLSPRLEAQSDAFELVGLWRPHELPLLIQDYASNTPVLDAQVEVQMGKLKAAALFDAAHGHYLIQDKAMLAALGQAGDHPMLITLWTPQENDLLDAVLHIPQEAAEQDRQASSSQPERLTRNVDGSVHVPMTAQRRLGIRTQMPRPTQAHAAIELAARVAMDPNASGRVQSAQGGRLEPGPQGLPRVGQSVKQGDILAYVQYLPDPYAQANQQAQRIALGHARQLAAQRVQRLSALADSVPRKERDAARAELQSLSEQESRILASLDAREPLTAPVSGVIARSEAVAGQIVEAREWLFDIVDPSRWLIEAVTADTTLPARIREASLAEAPNAQLKLIGASLSLRDGMLPVLFQLQSDQPALPLALGQPVTLHARLAEPIEGYVLPAEAIVRNAANEAVVWIKSRAERYLPQDVRFRMLDAQTVIVTQGLGPDNRVVTEGAALLAQIR